MAAYAASRIVEALGSSDNPSLCVATGESPKRVYSNLAARHQNEGWDTSRLTIIKLDEWYPMRMDDAASCEVFLQQRVIQPLQIDPSMYISFDGSAHDAKKECLAIDDRLDRLGGIDVCVLGLGTNGHVGLNEPGDHLELRSHRAEISATTMLHPMISGKTVHSGLTLGMRDLLTAKRIILLVSGQGKGETVRSLFSGRITTLVPASLLLLHSDIDILCDSEVLPSLDEELAKLARRL